MCVASFPVYCVSFSNLQKKTGIGDWERCYMYVSVCSSMCVCVLCVCVCAVVCLCLCVCVCVNKQWLLVQL